MWTIHPRYMCGQHLLGEHVEMHMFVGTLAIGRSIQGYITNGLVDPRNITDRHNLLAQEMKARGYNHKTPMDFDSRELPQISISKNNGFDELLNRCGDCRSRYHQITNKK